jgi:type I restriction enzyme M protein
MDDDGKISKSRVTARLKELADAPQDDAEIAALQRYLALAEAEAEARKAAREAQAALEKKTLEKYADLTEDEIKDLAVSGKWMRALENAILAQTQGIASRLAARLQELEERYARPLPELEREVEEYAARVAEHLKQMGVAW